MASLSGHLRYLRFVVRHKRFVYQEARALGVGRWQAAIHDWHKFLPGEWFPYAEYFEGGENVPAEMRAAYFLVGKVTHDFQRAWLEHQKKGRHHWQFWVLHEDDGDTKVLPMPEKYLLEMVADWRGAGRAIKGHSSEEAPEATRKWYEATRVGRMLEADTQEKVERLLGVPA